MSLRRFYCPQLPQNGQVMLDRDQADHARKSLRLSAGGMIELFDGRGHIARATIAELSRTLTATIDEHRAIPPLVPALVLAVAIPKGSRADTLIDQATQLGVTEFIPLITERSIVEPRDRKLDRFGRIMLEACKQSHRAHLMTIADPTPLPDVLKTSGADVDLRLIADVPPAAGAVALQGNGKGDVQSLHSLSHLNPTITSSRRILVLVGPEGGWTDNERRIARDAGCQSIALGPHILRVETAALAAAAVIRAACGSAT